MNISTRSHVQRDRRSSMATIDLIKFSLKIYLFFYVMTAQQPRRSISRHQINGYVRKLDARESRTATSRLRGLYCTLEPMIKAYYFEN